MAEQEAADLNAGRIRLADLADDDYDYGGKRGRKKKGKKKGKQNRNTMPNGILDDEDEATAAFDDAMVPNEDVTINNENDESILDCDVTKVENDGSKECAAQLDDGHDVEVIVNSIIDENLCHEVNEINIETLNSSEDESSEEEPNSWRCEICRKDFKSDKQFDNHERSKKHKEAVRKYQTKLRKETEKNAFRDMMDEIEEEQY
jgi:DnaJ family protein A protein 5